MGKKDLGEPEFGLRAHSTEWWRPAASPGASPRASPIRGVAQPAGQPDPGGGSARFPAWLATRLATRLATWLAARLARGLAPGRLAATRPKTGSCNLRRPWVYGSTLAGYRITPRIIDPKSIGSQRGGRPPVMTQEL